MRILRSMALCLVLSVYGCNTGFMPSEGDGHIPDAADTPLNDQEPVSGSLIDDASDDVAADTVPEPEPEPEPEPPPAVLPDDNAHITDQTIATLSFEPFVAVSLDVPFTTGMVFKKGELQPGDNLILRPAQGEVIPLQVDLKAGYEDGSVKHAVLSGVIPQLSGQVVHYSLEKGTVSPRGSVFSLQQLAARGVTAEVELTVDGVRYQTSLARLLSTTTEVSWLAGNVVNEWHLKGALTDVNGLAHPHLEAGINIRSYGSADAVRIEIVVENTWSYEDNPSNIGYDLQVIINGRQVLNQQNLTHYHHARWRRLFWVDSEPRINIRHDYDYLTSTGAVPVYDPDIQIPVSVTDNLAEKWSGNGYDLMGIGIIGSYMPQTGARPELGPLPSWAAIYLLTMNADARKVVLGHGDQAGSWSIHYRDKETGLPTTIDDHPYMTILGRRTDTLNPETREYEAFPECSNCDTPYTHDTAHQPSLAFLPYLISGDYYYLEELQFWANFNMLTSNPYYRGLTDGLLSWQQVRGQGWSLRTLAQAAWITPDTHPLKSYFEEKLDRNRDNYAKKYLDDPAANKLGWIEPLANDLEISPWMDDFFTWAVGYTISLGYDDWKEFFKWKAQFPVGRMTGDGFCYVHGSSYRMNASSEVGDSYYESFAQLYRGILEKYSYADLPCVSEEMGETFGIPAGSMTGYPYSATGYPSNLQPALAIAAQLGVEGADAAWNKFSQRTVQPDYSKEPQFALVPFSVRDNSDESPSWDVEDDTADEVVPEEESADNGGIIEPVPLDTSHFLANLDVDSWYRAVGTSLSQVAPESLPDGNTGLQSVMSAWSGAAFDTSRNTLIVWGGGHTDYSGNEIYTFDVRNQSWARAWGPTSPELINRAVMTETYTDGAPVSRHTYSGLTYLPPPYDMLWSQGGSRWVIGYSTKATWGFDFSLKQWKQLTDAPDTSLGVVSAYDPVSGKVYMRGLRHFLEYDPATDSWQSLLYEGWGYYGDNTVAAIDSRRRLMVFVGGKATNYISEYGVFDLQTSEYFVPDFSGDTEILEGNAPGIAYDTRHDRIVAWDGGKGVYVLDTDTWEWKFMPLQASAESPGDAAGTGTFGRFQYIESYDVFMVVNSVDDDAFFLKLSD